MESAVVRGDRVALPGHFHDEHQITVVLSGQRRFVVAGRTICVSQGCCLVIPARVVHASLAEPAG
ncbi:MAG TPA: cupin domain-containing protein, partial [Mycobacterium sp.]|nr:cupin domain-containing protein [Mycobacterium sp.]